MANRTSQELPPRAPLTAAQSAILAARAASMVPVERAAPLTRAELFAGPMRGTPLVAPTLPPLPAAVAVPVAAAGAVARAAAPRGPNPALRQTGMPAYEFPLGDAISAAVKSAGTPKGNGKLLVPQTKSVTAAQLGAAASAIANFGRAAFTALVPGAPAILDTRAPASDTDALPAAAAGGGAAPVRTVDGVNQALAQGRAADATPMSPQDALGAVITQALGGGASFNEIKELGALVPAVVKQGQSSKDARYGVAGSVTDTLYKAQLAAAQKLPEGDERDQAILKATQDYNANNAALLGVNMANFNLAKRLAADEDN